MSTKTDKPRAPQYGCCASYTGPAPAVLMRNDYRALYRRPSINLRTGEIIRTADGAIAYDETVQASRAHLSMAAKGWECVRIVEAPEDVLAAQANGTAA